MAELQCMPPQAATTPPWPGRPTVQNCPALEVLPQADCWPLVWTVLRPTGWNPGPALRATPARGPTGTWQHQGHPEKGPAGSDALWEAVRSLNS